MEEKFFQEYMNTDTHLTRDEQDQKFHNMHITEIKERAILLKGLNYDKNTTKKRIKNNIEWGFEPFELPTFYNEVDAIVERIYDLK